MYIHQLYEWPKFTWDSEILTPILTDLRFNQGKLLGKMGVLGFDLQSEAMLQKLQNVGCEFGQGYHISRPGKMTQVSINNNSNVVEMCRA